MLFMVSLQTARSSGTGFKKPPWFKVRPLYWMHIQYLQLGRSFKNSILLKHMSFTDDPPDHFSQFFFFFDFINKIENVLLHKERVNTSILDAETLWMVTNILLCVLMFSRERMQLFISLRIKMSTNTMYLTQFCLFLNDRNIPRMSKILKSATLTKLINDVDVILNLETSNVCYHMLVKYV